MLDCPAPPTFRRSARSLSHHSTRFWPPRLTRVAFIIPAATAAVSSSSSGSHARPTLFFELQEIEELSDDQGSPERPSSVPIGTVSRFLMGEDNRKRADAARKVKEERDALKAEVAAIQAANQARIKAAAEERRANEKRVKAAERRGRRTMPSRSSRRRRRGRRKEKNQKEWEAAACKRVQVHMRACTAHAAAALSLTHTHARARALESHPLSTSLSFACARCAGGERGVEAYGEGRGSTGQARA